MKIGIMQPYFFPYIGYFQLINAVDTFVLYDDVNYIKGGWINRNRILFNSNAHLITIPLIKASSFNKINEIDIDIGNKKNKIIKTIKQAYSKAHFYSDIFPILEQLFLYEGSNLAAFLENSIKFLCNFLGIKTDIVLSSGLVKDNNLVGQNKVISICKFFNATEYINAIGGQGLYDKKVFSENELKLDFIKTDLIIYDQFKNEFVPNLSIIDLLMFNRTSEIKNMLLQFRLI